MVDDKPQRCLLFLSPSAEPAALQDAVLRAADELVMTFTPTTRLDGGIATPNAPFVAGLEAPGGPSLNAAYFASFLAALGDTYDPATTIALTGVDHSFVDVDGRAAATPVRYQYLMRRRRDFTHEAYCDRYRDVHSAFGVATPGIVGYVQCHVDPVESELFARSLDLEAHEVDSVSELYLDSLETFYAALASEPEVGIAASADEELFVDRPSSQMITSTVHHQGEWHEC